MPVFNNALAGASGQGSGGGYVIEKSLRFTKGDGAYLNRTFSGTPNKKKFTFSVWFKGAVQHSHQYLLQTQHVSSNYFEFTLNAFKLQAYNAVPGINVTLARQLRDPSAWYHAVLAVDTTQAVEADRLKIYLNGEHQTDYISGGSTFPAQNAEFELPNRDWYIANAYFNSTTQSTNFFDGYMAEFHYVDGEAKDVTDFGAFDDNGVWQAAEFTGSHGTNGFYLDFADGSNIGNDAAGSNNWTSNNLTGPIEVNVNPLPSSPGDAFDGTPSSYAYGGSTTTFTFATAVSVTGGRIDLIGRTGYVYRAVTNAGTFAFTESGTWPGISGTYAAHFSVSDASITSLSQIECVPSSGSWTLGGVQVTGDPGTVGDQLLVKTVGTPESTDIYVDSPTNGDPADDTEAGGVLSGNYCTWNPLTLWNGGGSMELVDGNLNFGDQGTASRYGSIAGSIAVNSGKWFVECTLGSGTGLDSTVYFGLLSVEDQVATNSAAYFNTPGCIAVKGNAQAYKQGVGSTASYASGIAVGDTLSIAFNCDDGTSTWYLNGTSLGSFPYSFDSSKSWTPFASDWSNNQPCSEFILNCGQRPFSMTPPTGYKAICTANLPTSDVPDGSDYFDTKLYDGTGAAQTISGLSFSPDLVWLKRRSSAESNTLFDTVRGAGKELIAESTSAEYDAGTSSSGSLIAFNNDGFNLGTRSSVNGSSTTNVAWVWDGGTTTDNNNTDGDITSSVRANPSAGFSIVKWTSPTWTGSAVNRQVGHGLGAPPAFIITKGIDSAAGWYTYHKDLDTTNPNDYYLTLNTSNAAGSLADSFGPNVPDSTTFGDRLLGFSAGEDAIAFCWTPVEGFSVFGSYIGNGTTDPPFVYTGMRPAFVVIKAIDQSDHWYMYDAKRDGSNPLNHQLTANLNDIEYDAGTYTSLDLMSNGFKLRGTAGRNVSNIKYLYLAFAENPFQANGGLAR